MAVPSFEAGNTVMFTWVASVAPDSAPTLKIFDTRSDLTAIASITAQQSSSTSFYALYTMPGSSGLFLAEWYAPKTVVSSVYPFIRRFQFRSDLTQALD